MRARRDSPAVVVGLLVLWGGAATADPPSTSAGGGAEGTAAASQSSQGGFFSSLKQAFSQNVDRELVWGHFDVGSPPNTHRFYCLIDPKTGKREPNGVAGEPFLRHDGTTGLKTPAVSPASCAEAEQKGILVTAGYVLKGAAAAGSTTPSAQKTAPAAPAPAASAAPPSAPVAAPAPVASAAPPSAPVAAPAPAPSSASAVSAAPPMPIGEHADDRAYIRQAESDWAESVATRDARVLERILSEDFIGVDAEGTSYSKADAIREYRTQPSSYTSNRLNQVQIRFYGQTAIAQGDESWKKKDGRSGKYVWTDTWIQRDGKWQIVAAEDLVPPVGGSEHR